MIEEFREREREREEKEINRVSDSHVENSGREGKRRL